jgi:XTP/dITP diphosphohydrolase
MSGVDRNFSCILLASGNHSKLEELRALLPAYIVVKGLEELGIPTDLPEDGTTLEENALQKAREAHRASGLACLADDSGLEVEALEGAPGVYSARFAGPEKDDRANMELLLRRMEGHALRRARFRTVLALVSERGEQLFEGVVEGRIVEGPRGSAGFGYDPIFVPDNDTRTFAEMDPASKNAISHRGQAMKALLAYLERHDQRCR